MDSVISTRSSLERPTPHSSAWVRTWGASPQAPDESVSRIEPSENATLRQIVRITGGGHRIRLRISNEYGTAPLTVGAAHVALTDTDDAWTTSSPPTSNWPHAPARTA
ncbi:hypothetical protein ACFV5G_18385 [Streptomyces sp. NPDC059766]|uniref:hypothetical protein n=1 Tax=Streptomyces sp. NPDC059766 TaxID=3346940 RepID=UPI00364772E3